MTYILYLIIGAIAGSLSGLLGIGGGIIIIPALVFLFKNSAIFANNIIMHVAAGTSLAIMIFTSSSAAAAYYKRGFIVWPIVFHSLPGLCFGMICGALISKHLSSDKIILLFAIFLVTIAMFLFFHKQEYNENHPIVNFQRFSVIKKIYIFFSSIGVGLLATIFGIGGGILMVPFFLTLGCNIRNASGSSSICGLPIAIIGTILLTITGFSDVSSTQVAKGTFGFVYWPAVLIISISSILFAPLGTRLAMHCKPHILKKILAGLLIITAINLVTMH